MIKTKVKASGVLIPKASPAHVGMPRVGRSKNIKSSVSLNRASAGSMSGSEGRTRRDIKSPGF